MLMKLALKEAGNNKTKAAKLLLIHRRVFQRWEKNYQERRLQKQVDRVERRAGDRRQRRGSDRRRS